MSSISEKQDAHDAATTAVDSGSGSVEVLTAVGQVCMMVQLH
jgi:hypothetical protein